MGRLSASTLALALAAVAALALSACGGNSADLLPGATASEINANLDKVEQQAAEGDCIGAEDAAAEVSAQVEALSGVDRKLKQALGEGAERLSEVVSGCEETGEEFTETTEPEEPEPEDKNKKPEKNKPEKEVKEPPEGETETPAQNGGEGKGAENGNGKEAPETGSSSGGVGPGAPAGEE